MAERNNLLGWLEERELKLRAVIRKATGEDAPARQIAELDASLRTGYAVLAQHGWYIEPDLVAQAVPAIASLFERGNNREAHDGLCQLVETKLDSTEAALLAAFPDRAHLVSQAISAHRREEYALSIPVFLGQADGICAELLGEQLFSRQGDGKTQPSLSKLTNKVGSPTAPENTFLAPLLEPAPISWTQRERAGAVDILNRHAILHGESKDYDTHLNSCRTLWHLRFVAAVLKATADSLG